MSLHQDAAPRLGTLSPGSGAGASFTGNPFVLLGGYYQLSAVGTFGTGNIQLQEIGPDNTTWVNVGAAVSAAGVTVLQLPPGSYRWTTGAGTTAVYATLVRISVG